MALASQALADGRAQDANAILKATEAFARLSGRPIGSCRGASDPAACDHIIEAETQFAVMLVSGDPKPVETYLADDAVWTLADGRTWTKPEAIVAISNGPRMAQSELARADVRMFGDVAVVQWIETWVTPGPTGGPGRTFGTDTWSKRDGRWRIIASQEARPPK